MREERWREGGDTRIDLERNIKRDGEKEIWWRELGEEFKWREWKKNKAERCRKRDPMKRVGRRVKMKRVKEVQWREKIENRL